MLRAAYEFEKDVLTANEVTACDQSKSRKEGRKIIAEAIGCLNSIRGVSESGDAAMIQELKPC